MTISIQCAKCGKPLTLTLPDEFTEAEAQAIGRRAICELCGMKAQTGQTRPGEPTEQTPPARLP